MSGSDRQSQSVGCLHHEDTSNRTPAQAARTGPIRARDGDSLWPVMPPETSAIQLHGHRVTYRIGGDDPSGQRPVLLLVHGMAGSSATWREVMPALAQHYTVIAPDLPGHGDSDKPRQDYSLGAHANALRDLLIALGVHHATVVGQSLGGGVAMQLAYQHPQYCERLVLVSSGGLGHEVSWMLRALAFPGADYLMPALFPSFVRDAGNAIGRRLGGFGLRAPRLEEMWHGYGRSPTRPPDRRSYGRCGPSSTSAVKRSAPTIGCTSRRSCRRSSCGAVGTGSSPSPTPTTRPGPCQEVDSEIFAESGHFPHAEEPERFVAAVVDFMERTSPAHLEEHEWRQLLTAGPPVLPADDESISV